MKKFKYSMENLLQIKIKLEDQVKIAYGNARLRLTMEEQKLQAMEQQKASYEDEMRKLRSEKLDITKIKQCAEAIEVMNRNIKIQISAVKEAEQRLETARIRLHNAMVERKTQEKLREKAWTEYLLEFDVEERKEIDELNSYQYSKPTLGEEDR